MDDQVRARVAGVFQEALNTAELDFDTPLVDYGLDSVRATELVIEIEQLFGIAIKDEEVAALQTARAVADHVTAKLALAQRRQ